MSGFKYKTTDLNEMIGPASITVNSANSVFIKDTANNSNFTQYYVPLRNDSGPPGQVTSYIGRLYNNALYTTSPILQDVKNSVIARHDDFITPVTGLQVNQNRPPWANSCSVIIIGGGGGGAAGQQGFQKQGSQTKDSQDGRGGGAGGAAGMVSSYDIQLTSTDQITIDVAAGGTAGVFANNNNSTAGGVGGSSVIYFKQAGTTQLSITALGGQFGTVGSSNGQAPGTGGVGGWWSNTGPLPSQTQPYRGKDGQDGNPSAIFNFVNGGNVSLDSSAGNILPYQIISNGGGNQFQSQAGNQVNYFVAVQGYGAGGAGGAAGTSNGPAPAGTSNGGAGGNGFVRIYWLNKA